MHIASQAPDHVFVHAGAVAVGRVGLMLPGPALVGKSTLVAALVHAGASYLSDEYAVLDRDGGMIPYPRRISLRSPGVGPTREVDAARLGRVATGEPLPAGIVVLTEYRPGATWYPNRLTRGEGALSVFTHTHTFTASRRPEDSLRAIRRAVDGAVILEGPRGEAEDLAPALIAEMEALTKRV